MLRASLLKLGASSRVRSLVTSSGWARRRALGFVAGETLEEGLGAVRDLTRTGRTATLTYLGEDVTSLEESYAACEVYLAALDRIGAENLNCGVSVKPTQMGLHIDADACRDLVGKIAAACDGAGIPLCLDMESSAVTDRTIWLVERLRADGHDAVGCAVQAYLHRTRRDIERLTHVGANLRLCKGAYAEPPEVAFQSRRDVDVNFARCGDYLLRNGRYPQFATHDGRLIDYLRYAAAREDRAPDDWEFQMLYGVREALQTELVSEGLGMRVYVPFGEQWYPYFMRRLAERPANLSFFLKALVRG